MANKKKSNSGVKKTNNKSKSFVKKENIITKEDKDIKKIDISESTKIEENKPVIKEIKELDIKEDENLNIESTYQKHKNIYEIQNEEAEEKIAKEMESFKQRDAERIQLEEEEKLREKTDGEKIVEGIDNAYKKKGSKLPLITGLLIGIVAVIIVVVTIINTYNNQSTKAYYTECESAIGTRKLESLKMDLTRYRDQIQEMINNNEPRDDDKINKRIENYSNYCEKGLGVPEGSIYYYYKITGK